MPANYPTIIYTPVTKANKSGVIYDAAKTKIVFAEDFNNPNLEIVALETLVGKNDDSQTAPIAGAILKGKASGKSKWSTELFIDTSGNVGIGTTSPSGRLDIHGAGTTTGINTQWADLNGVAKVTILDSGNVGIGTTAPTTPLEIKSSISTATLNDKPLLYLWSTANGTTNVGSEIVFAGDIHGDGTNNAGFASIQGVKENASVDNYDSALRFGTRVNGGSITEKVRITSTGNVGIGTTDPTALLDINSNILRLRTAKTPASAGAAGNTGDICWDANYLYICIATNTWVRSLFTTWV